MRINLTTSSFIEIYLYFLVFCYINLNIDFFMQLKTYIDIFKNKNHNPYV